jgi:hypothetical protein
MVIAHRFGLPGRSEPLSKIQHHPHRQFGRVMPFRKRPQFEGNSPRRKVNFFALELIADELLDPSFLFRNDELTYLVHDQMEGEPKCWISVVIELKTL